MPLFRITCRKAVRHLPAKFDMTALRPCLPFIDMIGDPGSCRPFKVPQGPCGGTFAMVGFAALGLAQLVVGLSAEGSLRMGEFQTTVR